MSTKILTHGTKLVHLIPGSEVDRLIALGQGMSQASWEIGRRTLVYIDMLNAPEYADAGILLDDIYRGVGELTGRSKNSVRQYTRVARFFPQEVQDEFDVLPFSHFVTALEYAWRWREVLEISINRMEVNGGRPPSVEWLEMQMRNEEQPGGAPPVQYLPMLAQEALPDGLKGVKTGGASMLAPANSEFGLKAVLSTHSVISALTNLVTFMYRLVKEAPLQSTYQNQLLEALSSLQKAVVEVEKEMRRE